MRVLGETVMCWGIAIPKGEYDGFIYQRHQEGRGEPIPYEAQLMADGIAGLEGRACEVLRYLNSKDIEIVS